jgi:hypothetical protein
LGFCVLVFWVQPFFVRLFLCILCPFEMPLVLVTLAFTL